MPQGNYDARSSGNYKIVNGKRVPLPPRSSNDARAGGERGPKGSRTYTREDTSSGQGIRDIFGVPFSPDPMGRPIASIARDVAAKDQRLADIGRTIPSVERAGSIKAWNYDTVKDMPAENSPISRPWGKEGKVTHPDFRASSVAKGAEEAARARRNIDRAGRQQGFTPQDLRQYTGPLNQVSAELRAAGKGYEKEYADKYLSTQTQRMRDMMDRRKTPEQRGRENLAEVRNRNRREETNRLDRDIDFKPIPGRSSKFANTKPPEIHSERADPQDFNLPRSSGLNSMPRGGNNGGPATASSVARDLGDYATRPLSRDNVYAESIKTPLKAPVKSGSTGRTGKVLATGALLAAAAGADRLMSGADKAINRPTKTEQMKSDASDMGPVKGRVLTRKMEEAAAGTRKQPTKIVPYDGQGKMSKALGVSNIKPGQNR